MKTSSPVKGQRVTRVENLPYKGQLLATYAPLGGRKHFSPRSPVPPGLALGPSIKKLLLAAESDLIATAPKKP